MLKVKLDQKQIIENLQKAKTHLPFFTFNFLKIRTKTEGIKSFLLNNIQLDFNDKLNKWKGKYRKIIILKARQFGMSTFIEAMFFRNILLNQGKNAFVIAHNQSSSQTIFDITSFFYENLPDYVKELFPQDKANAKEIRIKYSSSEFKVGTAGNKELGRGMKNNYLHCSEVAFWENPENLVAGLMETVANEGDNLIIFESTANGYNFFKEEFEKGLDPNNKITKSVFYGWNQFYEYKKKIDIDKEEFIRTLSLEERNLIKVYKLSLEQINWRREKIELGYNGREYLFHQEYPLTWQEAFSRPGIEEPLIDYKYIYQARKNDLKESQLFPIVAGVDPARQGKDRTVITIRQGRKILHIITLTDKTAPEIEGYLIKEVIGKINPQMIFVDAGYGLDIVDHIKEKGYKKIKAVFFNGRPENEDKYVNIRSEMHDKVRDWFMQDGGVDIKDDDEICNEYSIIPDMKINSSGKLFMISKEDIKENNYGRSPDYFDSLALTFAEKVFNRDTENIEYKIVKKKSIF